MANRILRNGAAWGLCIITMTDTVFDEIAQRREEILQRMRAVSTGAGRTDAVTLVGISKVQPNIRIEAALAAGQRVFGESRVQEAQSRWQERRAEHADLQLRLVGPLQTNKAEDAVRLFDVIETLDRPKLAKALAKSIQKTGREIEILIQVNTGEEPQKAGVLPDGLQDLLEEARTLDLNVSGLMCIPPVDEPAGPHFALLAKLAAWHGLAVLSMGMSADYETAIRFGATHVRVGSGLFGDRET